MRRTRSLPVLLGLALAAGVLVGTAGPAAARTIHLDGVAVRLPAGTSQVVTVNHTRRHRARVTFWERDPVSGRWHREYRTRDGHTGYGGFAAPRHRRQGSGTTPLGTVGLRWAFGTHPRASDWRLGYRQVRPGDYWVEDNQSRYYNRYRSRSQGGFRWWLPVSRENGSERLSAYPRQYEYAVVTGYNYLHPVRHRGAGIFLHVNGRGATAGCVSAPRWFMVHLMRDLAPSARPVMAVGR
jgi:L,D-peptidoglycan transpeptidase YkuD (ErfK/YbiS/YcfS/YnhG family)